MKFRIYGGNPTRRLINPSSFLNPETPVPFLVNDSSYCQIRILKSNFINVIKYKEIIILNNFINT